MGEVVVVPSPRSAYAELTAGGTGRYPRFRKHLLNLGTLKYQGREFALDDAWYARLASNFRSGVSMVQVPLADDANRHTEDPLRNAGEVVDLQRDGNKVYSVIEVRNPAVADGIRNRTIMGASAFLSMNHTDTRTGRKCGPALLHHCLTNRPYLLDLDPYEEIAATAADWDPEDLIVASQPEGSVTKEDLLSQLREEHGIDVEQLQQQASQRADTAALTAAVTEALSGSGVQLTAGGEDGQLTLTDITGAVAELAGKNQALASDVAALKTQAAEHQVDALIDAGRLLPKTRGLAVELALTNPDGLDAITAPADAPYVQLSSPAGRPAPDGEEAHDRDIDAEVARLTSQHPEVFSGGSTK